MIKKVALWSGSLVTIILIILAIVFALFFKEKIRAKEIQPQSTILQKISEQKELRVGMLRSLNTLYVDYRNPNVFG